MASRGMFKSAFDKRNLQVCLRYDEPFSIGSCNHSCDWHLLCFLAARTAVCRYRFFKEHNSSAWTVEESTTATSAVFRIKLPTARFYRTLTARPPALIRSTHHHLSRQTTTTTTVRRSYFLLSVFKHGFDSSRRFVCCLSGRWLLCHWPDHSGRTDQKRNIRSWISLIDYSGFRWFQQLDLQ